MGQMIFDGAKTKGEGTVFSTNGAKQVDIHMKLDLPHTTYKN